MSSDAKPTARETWNGKQVYTMATVCLLAGLTIGFLAHGTTAGPNKTRQYTPTTEAPRLPHATAEPSRSISGRVGQQLTPLFMEVSKNPYDFNALVALGNAYSDAGQYGNAADFYRKALEVKPEAVDVRADLATCYWYLGNVDTALAEYNKVLHSKPSHAGALFNLGMIRWIGKSDAAGAIKTWEQLLASNPNFAERQDVLQLIQRAKQGPPPGSPGAQ